MKNAVDQRRSIQCRPRGMATLAILTGINTPLIPQAKTAEPRITIPEEYLSPHVFSERTVTGRS